MANSLLLILSLSGLAALIPAMLAPFRRQPWRPDLVFWAVSGAALAGTAAASLVPLGGGWRGGLSSTLWVSIAASLLVFVGLALAVREAWRLMPLLLPYLVVLAVLATLWSNVPPRDELAAGADTWLAVHIAVSVATYALATLAAVAGTAVLLQERAVKRKRPTALTHKLPSISDASRLQARLLLLCAVVLGLGVVTGMAEQYLANGQLLELTHKTLLSILALAVILGLLALHKGRDLRGRRTARLILLAYLLLTLAYPGVKFVTDVLLA